MDGARPRLLVATDRWADDVRREAAAAPYPDLRFAPTREAAVRMLTGAAHGTTHFLVDPEFVGEDLPVLIALTAGEPGSGISLILLETAASVRPGAHAARTRVVDHPVQGWLARALAPGPEDVPPTLAEADLHEALREGRLAMRYQPIVRMADRRPVGLEVLARLEHPVHGTLPPDLFVPGMERAGLGWPFTQAVVQQAFADWDAGRLARTGLSLAVNFPLDVLKVPSALDWLESARTPTGIAASDLLVELTESQPIGEIAGLDTAVRRLRAFGYGIAIDDVGPDIRDHSALLGLPFTALKLDKDLVRRARHDGADRTFLIRAIAAARRAGLRTVAEGVEDAAIWHAMRALGIDEAQGFLISRPLPPQAVAVWLAGGQAQAG